jgi:hypothetical protein
MAHSAPQPFKFFGALKAELRNGRVWLPRSAQRLSGVRKGEDLSSFRNSCSARR